MSNIILCSQDSICFYSFTIFNFIALLSLFVYISIFVKVVNVIKKKHFLFYSIRVISNFFLLFAFFHTMSIINFIVINFIDFIAVIIQLYLMFSEIIDITEGKNIFESDVSFRIKNFSVFFFFIIFSKFPISVLIEFELFTDFQAALFIIYTIVYFYHTYSKVNDVSAFINEKDTSPDCKMEIVVKNVEVIDLHKIYSMLKSVMYVNFSFFLFCATFSLMNKFVTNKFMVTVMIYAGICLKEIICLVHFGGMSAICYKLNKKEEVYGEKIEDKEDNDDEEEIKIELGNPATQT